MKIIDYGKPKFWMIAIIIACFIGMFIFLVSVPNWDAFGVWIEKSITELKIWQLILIICFSNLFFGGSK